MAAIRATKAEVDLEMRRLDQRRDIIERLYLEQKLSPPAIAERLGTKEYRLRAWMEINGMSRDPKQAQQARLERQKLEARRR